VIIPWSIQKKIVSLHHQNNNKNMIIVALLTIAAELAVIIMFLSDMAKKGKNNLA
jgi:hypothetical protein